MTERQIAQQNWRLECLYVKQSAGTFEPKNDKELVALANSTDLHISASAKLLVQLRQRHVKLVA